MDAVEDGAPFRQNRRRPYAGGGARLAPYQATALVGLIAAELLLFGGVRPGVAIVFAALQALSLIGFCLFPVERRGKTRTDRPLALALCGFLALLTWLGLTLTPYAGHGAPEWRGVSAIAAITVDRWSTLSEIIKLGGLACVFAAGRELAMTPTSARRAQVLIGGGAMLFALWAIFAFRKDPTEVFGFAKTYHTTRLTASFLSANTAGAVFGALSALGVVNTLDSFLTPRGVSMQNRVISGSLWLMVSGVTFGAMLMSASRAALAATAVVVAISLVITGVILARKHRARRSLLLASCVILLVAASLPSLFHSQMAARLDHLATDMDARSQIIMKTLAVAEQRPWQGFGLGTYRTAMSADVDPPFYAVFFDINAAHNVIAQWWIETGLIGVLLMVATIGMLMWGLLTRAVYRSVGAGRAAGALAFSAVLIGHNAFDYSLQVSGVAALWALVLGLAYAPRPRSPSRSAATRSHRSRSGRGAGTRDPIAPQPPQPAV